jgi:hypothetical protein
VRLLRDTNDQTIRTWAEQLARRPRIEVTFDHEMSAAQLAQPDPWLRVVVVRPRGDEALVRRVPLGHDGRAPQPMMPGPGFTETFTLRDLQPGELKEAWWIVMMRAEGGNIVDTGAPPQLLDADYLGVELTPEDLDKLWNVTAPQGMGDLIPRIGDTGATLPQSGDGTAGGRFASWFSVLGVGP